MYTDFFIFKDRVWQILVNKAYGISVGDPKPAVLLTLGEKAVEYDNFILFKDGTSSYRVNNGLDKEKKGYVTRGDALNAVLIRRDLFGLR